MCDPVVPIPTLSPISTLQANQRVPWDGGGYILGAVFLITFGSLEDRLHRARGHR